MGVREKLFSELQTICKDTGVDFTKTNRELSEFIGNEELIDYCITRGPLSSFPDTVFDIMLLVNKFLYDYEMRQESSLQHIVRLGSIIEIIEKFEKQEDEDHFSVSFRVSSMGAGLYLEGKIADKDNIRRFRSVVVSQLGKST